MAAQLAAAAAGVRPLITGPALRGAVLGSFTHAVIIGVPTATGPRVMSLLTARAAGVPTGVRVAGANPLPQPSPGAPALVGNGSVQLDGVDIRVTRYWDSRVQRIRPVHAQVAALRMAAARADRGVEDRPVEALRRALAANDCRSEQHPDSALGDAIDGLVGLGRGLTPGGDDVIAGLLGALHALGRQDVVDRVRSRLQGLDGRTTTLSADLLRLAVDGHACLEALGVLRSTTSADRGPAARAVGRLLSIGHTSGADLATGMAAGFQFGDSSPRNSSSRGFGFAGIRVRDEAARAGALALSATPTVR
ncbi:DUF2877 domain-containing protein [Nakamurella sp. GG22]